MFSDLFFIFLGGGIGSVFRYLITILGEKSMTYFFDKSHPIGTLVVK
jgi:fluoride ion exporter CrcB/FEX